MASLNYNYIALSFLPRARLWQRWKLPKHFLHTRNIESWPEETEVRDSTHISFFNLSDIWALRFYACRFLPSETWELMFKLHVWTLENRVSSVALELCSWGLSCEISVFSRTAWCLSKASHAFGKIYKSRWGKFSTLEEENLVILLYLCPRKRKTLSSYDIDLNWQKWLFVKQWLCWTSEEEFLSLKYVPVTFCAWRDCPDLWLVFPVA